MLDRVLEAEWTHTSIHFLIAAPSTEVVTSFYDGHVFTFAQDNLDGACCVGMWPSHLCNSFNLKGVLIQTINYIVALSLYSSPIIPFHTSADYPHGMDNTSEPTHF